MDNNGLFRAQFNAMSEQQNLFQDALSEEYARYLVNSRQEIAQILRALMRQNEIVTAYFNQGQEFFLTSVVSADLDSGRLLLDCGSDADVNRRAMDSNKFIFVSNQNRIKIQFSTSKLEQVDFKGRPAFRTQFPATLLKLQRREYYRLVAPIRVPLRCIVPDVAGVRVEAEVADISVGGVGISGFPPSITLVEGLMLPNCRIALPEEGTVVTALEIRNLQQVSRRTGPAAIRAGCVFVGLPAPHAAMIQRYIIRIDRERRALVRGS
jgi:c-di-GMP-binding flagellar brake protein YcgR